MPSRSSIIRVTLTNHRRQCLFPTVPEIRLAAVTVGANTRTGVVSAPGYPEVNTCDCWMCQLCLIPSSPMPMNNPAMTPAMIGLPSVRWRTNVLTSAVMKAPKATPKHAIPRIPILRSFTVSARVPSIIDTFAIERRASDSKEVTAL